LLIDEIDNFPTRGSTGHARHDDWSRGVVNSLLEQLDGAIERDGVIVVGATNDPTNIDGALLRPGRLDRHIAIPLPDDDARVAILKQHLGVDLDMRLLRRKTAGMSGADLERVARDARRLARREGVEVRHSHVARALPRREARTEDDIRYIAVHEVGHAVVAAVLGATIEEVYVCRDRDPNAKAEVAGAAVVNMRTGRRDCQWHADRVAHLLGGMAAEEAVYGSHGDGVVLDLAEASNLLTYAISTLGMGDTLVSDGHRDPQSLATARSYDPVLRRRVEDALQEQADRARSIIASNRQAFDELVERLAKRCRLLGAEVHDVVRAYAQPQLSLAI
jgi:cell division protease FtsH